MKIHHFKHMKAENKKITMVTCYDYWSACIVAESDIDCILVGDSLAMVMHGHATTVPATVDMMALHTQAVARGAKNKFIVGDMPFLSYRKTLSENMMAVEKLMHAGAHSVKLEGANGNEQLICHIVQSGVPVMGHIGMTPQSIHQLGGFTVQGKMQQQAEAIVQQALALEQAGCFAIVLECVPALLAKKITEQLTVPTIGIGAGSHTSGQVLVLHDLLGFYSDVKPKFVKQYCDGFSLAKEALNAYNREVKEGAFPEEAVHCY